VKDVFQESSSSGRVDGVAGAVGTKGRLAQDGHGLHLPVWLGAIFYTQIAHRKKSEGEFTEPGDAVAGAAIEVPATGVIQVNRTSRERCRRRPPWHDKYTPGHRMSSGHIVTIRELKILLVRDLTLSSNCAKKLRGPAESAFGS
jgi:hypothetical protein